MNRRTVIAAVSRLGGPDAAAKKLKVTVTSGDLEATLRFRSIYRIDGWRAYPNGPVAGPTLDESGLAAILSAIAGIIGSATVACELPPA